MKGREQREDEVKKERLESRPGVVREERTKAGWR